MSKQTKEQYQKAANRLTDFLEAFEQLKQEEASSCMHKEIIPLLSEIIQEDHQDLIPDLECLLRIGMNRENYYSYSLRQALRRLDQRELSRLKAIVKIATKDMIKRNGECNEIWEVENRKVHQVNAAIIDELDYRLQEDNK